MSRRRTTPEERDPSHLAAPPSRQRRGHRRSLTAVTSVLASTLLIVATGCGVIAGNSSDDGGNGGDSGDDGSGDGEAPSETQEAVELPVSSATTSNELGSDLEVEIQALERVGNGMLRLTVGLGNHTPEDINRFRDMREPSIGSEDLSGVTLLDTHNDTQHYPFTVENGDACFCGELDGLPSGVVEDSWVVFPEPPEGIETMSVLTPVAAPFHGIPITDAEEEVDDPGVDSPQILELQNETDRVVDSYQRHEDEDEITYELSSDVLFDSESAELSDEASDVLEEVADEIEISETGSVSVDGHADNTGDDEVNEPLSLERAEAVEDSLDDLVERNGLDYDVEGHGSADPIADNDTEEGREQNRRVTVTFQK